MESRDREWVQLRTVVGLCGEVCGLARSAGGARGQVTVVTFVKLLELIRTQAPCTHYLRTLQSIASGSSSSVFGASLDGGAVATGGTTAGGNTGCGGTTAGTGGFTTAAGCGGGLATCGGGSTSGGPCILAAAIAFPIAWHWKRPASLTPEIRAPATVAGWCLHVCSPANMSVPFHSGSAIVS